MAVTASPVFVASAQPAILVGTTPPPHCQSAQRPSEGQPKSVQCARCLFWITSCTMMRTEQRIGACGKDHCPKHIDTIGSTIMRRWPILILIGILASLLGIVLVGCGSSTPA